MLDPDPFDPERWESSADGMPANTKGKRKPARTRKPARFLKGPVPWPWLVEAMKLPGKALAVGLMLWREGGCAGTRTVYFGLPRAAADGIPVSTARRAIRTLEAARLVEVHRKPGRGLEVTILDAPSG